MRLVSCATLLAVTWLNLLAQTRQPRLPWDERRYTLQDPVIMGPEDYERKRLQALRVDTYTKRWPAFVTALDKWVKLHNPDTISTKDRDAYRDWVKACDSFRSGMKELGYR